MIVEWSCLLHVLTSKIPFCGGIIVGEKLFPRKNKYENKYVQLTTYFIAWANWIKKKKNTWLNHSQISCGCRIHRLHICWGVRHPPQKCPGYDGEAPVTLKLWEMRSTSSLPSLPGPLWPRVLAPDRVLSVG